MVKFVKFALISCYVVFSSTQLTHGQEAFDKVFKPSWKTKIGVSTYRTNIVLHNGSIFIGSNGLDRNSISDSLDGVFELDPKTGKIKHQFTVPIYGDNDVTGIALDGDLLFFGTDNYSLYCFNIKSKKMLWFKNLPYDVESKPALADINGDGIVDVFFSVQHNGFYLLDGLTGDEIWKFDKIKAHEGNPSPLAIDCNQDGINDFVVSGSKYDEYGADYVSIQDTSFRGNFHFALDGKSGKMLWIKEASSGVHSSPSIIQFDEKSVLVFSDYLGLTQGIDFSGNIVFQIPLDNYGSVSSIIQYENSLLINGNMIVPIPKSSFEKDVTNSFLKYTALDDIIYLETKGFISSTPSIADVLNKGNLQFIICSEEGTCYLANKNGLIKTFKLPSGIEAPMLLKDIDKDGIIEILISDLAGNLTCYKTKCKVKK